MENVVDVQVRLSLSEPSGLTETAVVNRSLIAQAYENMIAGDNEVFWKLLAPDVHFREAAGLPYAADVVGIEATKLAVGGMLGNWRSMHVEIIEYAAAGDVVIAYMMQNGISHAGRSYQGPLAEVFRFRDGKIYEWHPIYWDTKAVREAFDDA